MKLTVKNLGPVSSAEIDLSKDLIILTGQNNAGKTYLAYTLYGILKPNTSGGEMRPADSEIRFSFPKNDGTGIIDLKKHFSENYAYYLNYISTRVKKNLPAHFVVQDNFFHSIKLNLDGNLQKIHLQRIFKKSILGFADDDGSPLSFKKNNDIYKLHFQVKKGKDSITKKDIDKEVTRFLRAFFIDTMRTGILIPAERQGINLFSKELSLIKNRAFDALQASDPNTSKLIIERFNQFPKPIRDSLEIVQNLDFYKNQTSKYSYLADELEKTFLQGKISINDQGDVQFKPNQSDNTLDIHMSSSTVKSLSSLSIYLRHLAKENDFVIIDEPELNLHPDNQRKVARFLGRLVNEGFKVIISTHSDYITRELNSLLMLKSKETEENFNKLIKKYNFQENELISKDQTAVYLFQQQKPVEAISIDETGFNVKTIDKEATQLNQSSQDIYFSLFD